MDKIKPLNGDQTLCVAGIDDFGTFNEMPKPYREITATEFWAEFVSYSPDYQEYRQVCNFLDYKTMRPCRLYWWRNRGTAVILPQQWKPNRNGGSIIYTEEPRYFLLGCEHAWREISYQEAKERNLPHDGYQFHLSECTKCKTRHGAHSDD